MIQSNSDATQVGIYAGIAGAGAVGAHAGITALRDRNIQAKKQQAIDAAKAEAVAKQEAKAASKEAKRAARRGENQYSRAAALMDVTNPRTKERLLQELKSGNVGDVDEYLKNRTGSVGQRSSKSNVQKIAEKVMKLRK